ncbi:MAG TPA: hypothetical protein VMZ66_08735 [Aeromicrobium sp.]|nr:hypothetical protein [Aeromicrobium sp.]
MTWSPTLATIEPFVREVMDGFCLGDRSDVMVSALIGSTNRLWRFDVGGASYVVKELSHESVEQIDRRRRAAAFERAVFESGALAMPEPLFDRHNEIVVTALGSRGTHSLVRVHHWITGDRPADIPPSLAEAAGHALAVIHGYGRTWSTEPSGSLRWWEQDPLAVAGRLENSALSDIAGTAAALIGSAIEVIGDAESIEGEWIYSHADHKPQNALVVDAALAVLDWDECGHCNARLEAVESALRWSVAAEDPPGAFRAFLDGYGGISSLSERDFGKWVAALLAWFSFQARRALGDWATDAAFERLEAEVMTRDTVVELERTLNSLSLWSSWA